MLLLTHRTAALLCRLVVNDPGNFDGGTVAGGFLLRQITPDFDRGLGLLNILEKFEFAVKAAPASGLEQLREVFQPLLGNRAPTRDDIAAPRHV